MHCVGLQSLPSVFCITSEPFRMILGESYCFGTFMDEYKALSENSLWPNYVEQ